MKTTSANISLEADKALRQLEEKTQKSRAQLINFAVGRIDKTILIIDKESALVKKVTFHLTEEQEERLARHVKSQKVIRSRIVDAAIIDLDFEMSMRLI